MAADIGQGTTITFATTGWTAALINAVGWSLSRDAIETTDTSITGGKVFIPNDIYDPGEISIEFNFDLASTVNPPIDDAAETITIDWAGAGTNSQWTASGFMTGYEVTGALEDRMTASATLKLSGDVGFNFP